MKAALRHLTRSRGRTLLTLLAVLIPVYFLVFMFGFSNAMVADMFNTATRIDTGHLQVRHTERRGMGSAIPLMEDAASVTESMDAIDGIEWRTVRLDLPALAAVDDRSQTILLQGVVPEKIGPISTLGELVVDGRYLRSGDRGVVIGEELAGLLDVGVGDEIALLGAHPETGVGVLKLPVLGVYRAPLTEMGRSLVHTTLATSRELARSPWAATAVVARVADVDGPWDAAAIEEVRDQLERRLPAELDVATWRELAPQVDGYMRILAPTMLVIGAVFFGLGALVVTNTLYLSVLERTRELGLILSLGAARARVVRMILTEAAILAILGALGGAILGVSLVALVEALGGIPMPGSVAGFMRAVGMSPVLHMMLRWTQVAIAAAAMAGVAVLAALIPAWRAARLEPVEAMRYVE
jgi:ABC-type lipoprotein release transport system permease subunit